MIMPVFEGPPLQGKVAIVTGSASGIGRASAQAFAAAGARVVVADIDAAGGEETARLIREADGDALHVTVDVTDEESVATMVDTTLSHYGRLDAAHNNAGISPVSGNTVDCPRSTWDAIIAVNLTGVWQCMKFEIPAMLRSGGGAIVNTSSGVGLIAMAAMPPYVASKHGVIGITKVAALDYATQGIRVNAICPGTVLTPLVDEKAKQGFYNIEAMAAMAPMKRLGSTAEIAAAAVWLCSDASSFVTGVALPVDGGTVVGR
jgi:NAD(P)-dependent dehydrogenase (short-subunit alcohol dehydrogenase family)